MTWIGDLEDGKEKRMDRPIVVARYADNGEISHWEMVSASSGEVFASYPQEGKLYTDAELDEIKKAAREQGAEEAEEKLHRANIENARLTNNNARLRDSLREIEDLNEGYDHIGCDCHTCESLRISREALLPSGNKTPNPQEIDPNGKPSHEIDPSSAHYGSLNEWPS